LKELIEVALQEKLLPKKHVFNRLSKNYKLSSPLGSVQSNIIFDDKNTLPKELKLEASMKAFDHSYDILGLKEQDLSQQSKPFLGRKASSMKLFPDS
ncbi:hypothetical protein XENOCAPTIV_017917, partial [Xenoophorus captivus]